MSRWRPVKKNCLYVIPDVHGSVDLLKKVCDRILPLRKSDGGKDRLVFLGDYIDRHIDSHKVIDFCIDLKKAYPNQVTFILGNHELMLMQALNIQPGKEIPLATMSHMYRLWLDNGGRSTLFGYQLRNGINNQDGWMDPPRSKLKELFPKEHLEFFQNLEKFYEDDKHIFIHGGCNPQESLINQDVEAIAWDRTLVKIVQNLMQQGLTTMPWDKTLVCGHCVQSDKMPIVADNYMMIDCGSPTRLVVVEMNSRTAFCAYPDKNRLVKFELVSNKKKPANFFRRVK